MANADIIVWGSDSGTNATAVTVTNMDAAFATAMSSISANGGWIRIFPGSADYEIQDNLTIDKDNVRVECLPGVRIKRHDSLWTGTNGNSFVYSSGNAHITWLGGTFEAADSVSLADYIFINNVSAAEADNDFFTVDGASFDLRNVTANNVDNVKLIQYVGVAAGGLPGTKGGRIRNCNFQFSQNSQNSTRGIFAQEVQGLWIEDNWFGIHRAGGSFTAQVATGGIHLQDCQFFRIGDNMWRTLTGSYFMRLESSTAERGHGVVEGNITETSSLNHVIRLQGNDFMVIRDNNFGNHDTLLANISLEGRTSSTTQPRHCMISDNQFHSADYQSSGFPIHVQNWDGVDIQGNSIFNLADSQFFVGVEAAAKRVRYNSNTNSCFAQNASIAPRTVRFKGRDSEHTEDAYPGTFSNMNIRL